MTKLENILNQLNELSVQDYLDFAQGLPPEQVEVFAKWLFNEMTPYQALALWKQGLVEIGDVDPKEGPYLMATTAGVQQALINRLEDR